MKLIPRLFSFLGNLIDKHIAILKSNPHYKNVHIPEPDIIEPLEQKFPYVSEKSLDFMKVWITQIRIEGCFFRCVELLSNGSGETFHLCSIITASIFR